MTSISSVFARGLVSWSTDCVACVCLMRRASVLRLRLDLEGGVADWLFCLPSSTWAAVCLGVYNNFDFCIAARESGLLRVLRWFTVLLSNRKLKDRAHCGAASDVVGPCFGA